MKLIEKEPYLFTVKFDVLDYFRMKKSKVKEEQKMMVQKIETLKKKYLKDLQEQENLEFFFETFMTSIRRLSIAEWNATVLCGYIKLWLDFLEDIQSYSLEQRVLACCLAEDYFRFPTYYCKKESEQRIKESLDEIKKRVLVLNIADSHQLLRYFQKYETTPFLSLDSPDEDPVSILDERNLLIYCTKAFSWKLVRRLSSLYSASLLYYLATEAVQNHWSFNEEQVEIFRDYYRVREEIPFHKYIEYRHVFSLNKEEAYDQRFHEMHELFAKPLYLIKYFSLFYPELPSFKNTKGEDLGYFFYLNLEESLRYHDDSCDEETDYLPGIPWNVFKHYVKLFESMKEHRGTLGWLYCYLNYIFFAEREEKDKIAILDRIHEFYLSLEQQKNSTENTEEYFKDAFMKEMLIRDECFQSIELDHLMKLTLPEQDSISNVFHVNINFIAQYAKACGRKVQVVENEKKLIR